MSGQANGDSPNHKKDTPSFDIMKSHYDDVLQSLLDKMFDLQVTVSDIESLINERKSLGQEVCKEIEQELCRASQFLREFEGPVATRVRQERISEAATIVDLFFNEMANSLAEGDRVEIRGLCSFFVKEYKSYQGRNPKTGASVIVASKKLPFFIIGKELKERVDY